MPMATVETLYASCEYVLSPSPASWEILTLLDLDSADRRFWIAFQIIETDSWWFLVNRYGVPSVYAASTASQI